MLTSFFNKSTPLNFVSVSVYVAIFYFIIFFRESNGFDIVIFLQETGIFLLFILGLGIFNFIAKRNELTQRNAYKILLFAAFSAMLLQVLENDSIIIANLFVLLALRRIISLRSQIHVQQKIFDATFWICIASLFYFWSILFAFLVFVGIMVFVSPNYKNWLIPVVAFLTILSLTTAIYLYLYDSFFVFSDWYQESIYDFSDYLEITNLVPLIFIGILSLLSLFFYIGVIRRASANLQASHSIIILAALVALAVGFLAPEKNTGEMLFFMAPLSIIVTNYLQIIENKKFKESLLFLIFLFPFVMLFLV